MSRVATSVRHLAALIFAFAVSGACLAAQPAGNSQPAPTVDDAAAKAEILGSQAWRETMREFEQWLSVQIVYSKDEVKELRRQMQDRVDTMSKNELQDYLADLQEKLQVMKSPEAYETRAWAEDYLAKASDRAAAEFRKTLPDVAAMNATQLRQALEDIRQQRSRHLAERQAFDKLRGEQIASLREMQRQAAEARNRAASYPASNIHPGYSGGSLAPRTVTRYPGFGVGGFWWAGYRW